MYNNVYINAGWFLELSNALRVFVEKGFFLHDEYVLIMHMRQSNKI
jgi:hypothetical protein